MTRTAFLAALEQLLAPLPEAERKDALSYYEDYLDAAGPEKEASCKVRKFPVPSRETTIVS